MSSLRSGWYTVFVLMLAYISSFIDRQILSLLVGPMKRDMHLTDTQVSLLMGLSFALFYTLLGLPIGRLVDRANRRNIIIGGVAVWSLMTALCGGVKTYLQFFLARVGVGIGEATLSPAAYSMLADEFPKEKLATAISVYSAGIYIGSGVAVLIGAALVSMGGGPATVTLPVVGTIFAWQKIFFYIGLPGLFIALLLLTVHEPVRRNTLNNSQVLPLSEAFAIIWQQRQAFLGITLGITFISLVAYASSAWTPTYFVRTFGWTVGKAGFYYGLIVAIFSTAGIIVGGRYADSLSRRGLADGRLRVGLYASVALAAGAIFPLLDSPTVVLCVLPIPCFFVAFPFGASSAAIQVIMPNQVRGLAAALYLFILNLIALGFGPTLVALLTDKVFEDESALRYSLAIVVAGGATLAFGCYAYALAPYRRAVAASGT
jgi:MFS family permease